MGLCFVQSDSPFALDGYSSLAQRLAAEKDIYDALSSGMERHRKEGLCAWLAGPGWMCAAVLDRFLLSGSGPLQCFCPQRRDLYAIAHIREPVVIRISMLTKGTNGEKDRA